MHQEQAFSIMGIFIFLPKQKGQGRRWVRDVFVFWHYSTARGLVCVYACECNCCLLSLSKLEWPEDAQQPMKGKPGDIVRDIGRLWVSNDQSTVWQPSLSGNNGALFAELRCPCPAPNHFFINREAPTFAHKVLQWQRRYWRCFHDANRVTVFNSNL